MSVIAVAAVAEDKAGYVMCNWSRRLSFRDGCSIVDRSNATDRRVTGRERNCRNFNGSLSLL